MARLVAKDLRTTTARNIRVLEREAGLPWWSPAGDIRRELLKKAEVVPNVDRWRLPYLNKLLEERDTLVYSGEGEESEQLIRVKELHDLVENKTVPLL